MSLSGAGALFTVVGGALVGFIAGILSGMFGIGGGIIMSPGSRLLLGVTSMVAVSTSLLVVIPTSLVGAFSYTRNKLTEPRIGITVGVAGACMSPFGAMLSHKLGGEVVMLGTAGILLFSAVSTARSYRKACQKDSREAAEAAACAEANSESELGEPNADVRTELEPGYSPVKRGLIAAFIGLGVGFFSGVFGVGGGFIIVPALVGLLGIPIKKAIGTSLIAVGILAVPGIITHASYGTVDYVLAACLSLGVIPGSRVGARITFIASERRVTAAFAIFLGLAGIWLAITQLVSMQIL